MFAKDDGNRRRVELTELIRSVLVLVRHDLQQHDVDVEQQFDDPPLEVLGDRIQLQQVILNLVMNAIEAMQSRKVRTLRLDCSRGGGGKITVAVADTGSGIEPDHMRRLFDPLFSTKQRGMGMGLAICRSIIEGHEGKIWASSAPGGGSIFQFSLPPYVEERGPATAPSPPLADASPGKSLAEDTVEAGVAVVAKTAGPVASKPPVA
jgi:signal transduction histidine kinase